MEDLIVSIIYNIFKLSETAFKFIQTIIDWKCKMGFQKKFNKFNEKNHRIKRKIKIKREKS